MLSRSTTKTLAEVYHLKFTRYREPTPFRKREIIINASSFYDFLYVNDYEAWFLNAAKKLPHREKALKEFIMRLHTGETVASLTKNLTCQERSELGQRVLRNLGEDLIAWAQTPGIYIKDTVKHELPKLISELELDGYVFQDGKLHYTEADVFDTEEEKGILEKLIQDLELANEKVILHHLELSGTHYIDEKWDDSIANSRKFLESILQEIAAKNHIIDLNQPINSSIYLKPFAIRDYLESQGLIEPKEKEAISKVYGLLSETGGHPYIAQKDQARLMRNLSLTFAQFILLRFSGFIKSI